MKNFIVSFLLLSCLYAQSQTVIGRQNVDQFPIDQFGTLKFGLTWLPDDYNTTGTQTYPCIIFGHGAGDNGTGIVGLNNLLHTGLLTLRISQGFNPAAIDPRTRVLTKFIVISPQYEGAWWYGYPQLKYIVPNALSRYRIDPNRVYITGLSAGGDGSLQAISNADSSFTKLFAAIATASEADISTNENCNTACIQTNLALASSKFGVHAWFTCGDQESQEVPNIADFNIVQSTSPVPPAKFTLLSGQGHSTWNQLYDSAFRPKSSYYGTNANNAPATLITNIYNKTPTGQTQDSLNIFEWFLLWSRNTAPISTAPTANAGSNKTVILPATTTTLSGTATPGNTHSMASTNWAKLSGPAGDVIVTPNPGATTTPTTNITGLTVGTYVYQLTAKNEVNATATSTVTVTVQNVPAPVANAGSNQTITLPQTSVTLDGTGSTGTISSYAWTQVTALPANIVSPTTSTTSVTGLQIGSYIFKLSLNGGASSAQVTITVNAASAFANCGSGTKHIMVTNQDTAIFLGPPEVLSYNPGDTVLIPSVNSFGGNYYTFFALEGFRGNPACPLVIQAQGGQVHMTSGFNISNSSYVKISGGGVSGQAWGFRLTGPDTTLRGQGPFSFVITNRTSHIEVEKIYIHNVGIGFDIKTDGTCTDSLNYPNYLMSNFWIHNCKIQGTWNEGMYIGNTSPDNAANSYDPRPLTCNGIVTYPLPLRLDSVLVENMQIDSTGRGGIQFAAAGYIECRFNNVTHNGMNGDDAQGTSISWGTYTQAYIHDNNVKKTWTWGIASQGGSTTGKPQRLESNQIDSSGFLAGYPRLATTDDEVFNPSTEPAIEDDLPWPQSIFWDTKPTETPAIDSTIIWCKNNSIGAYRNNVNQAIVVQNDHQTLQLKAGNIICNNFLKNTAVLAPVFIDPTAAGFVFSTNCGSAPPTVSAGNNQTISSPASFVTLTGSATANGGTITKYSWSYVSGPAGSTITTPLASQTTVTGLVAGIYIYQLTVTDSNNFSNSSQVTVTVNSVAPPANCNCLINKLVK